MNFTIYDARLYKEHFPFCRCDKRILTLTPSEVLRIQIYRTGARLVLVRSKLFVCTKYLVIVDRVDISDRILAILGAKSNALAAMVPLFVEIQFAILNARFNQALRRIVVGWVVDS